MRTATFIVWFIGVMVAHDKGYGFMVSLYWPMIMIDAHMPENAK